MVLHRYLCTLGIFWLCRNLVIHNYRQHLVQSVILHVSNRYLSSHVACALSSLCGLSLILIVCIFCRAFRLLRSGCGRISQQVLRVYFYLSDFALEIIFATQNIFRPLRFMISFLPPFWVKFGSNHITRFSHHGILGAYGFIEPKFYEVVIEREKKTCKKGGGPISFGPNGKGGLGRWGFGIDNS